jgi:hypothetical protein
MVRGLSIAVGMLLVVAAAIYIDQRWGMGKIRRERAKKLAHQLNADATDRNYRMAQLLVRQIEQVQRADEVMPILTEAQRAENERLIRAFYDNQLPEGD